MDIFDYVNSRDIAAHCRDIGKDVIREFGPAKRSGGSVKTISDKSPRCPDSPN